VTSRGRLRKQFVWAARVHEAANDAAYPRGGDRVGMPKDLSLGSAEEVAGDQMQNRGRHQ
jgi:hypothetical protein